MSPVSPVWPGLTGLAQVYASRDLPRRKKFRYDLLYIRRQSFGLDLILIGLSMWITLRGIWESREAKFSFEVSVRRLKHLLTRVKHREAVKVMATK